MSPEEFIDTSQHAGGDQAKREAWNRWANRHLKELRLADETGLLRTPEWRNIAEHMLVVNAVAVWLARNIAATSQAINIDTVEQASILHDVDKRLLKEQGISRNEERTSTLRSDLLQKHGYSSEVITASQYTGRVAEIFLEDEAAQDAAIGALPLEKLIVAYADARVRNVDVVSLEEARDKNKEKIPQDAAFYDQWYRFYKKVEARIFALLDSQELNPEDLNNESVFAMVSRS